MRTWHETKHDILKHLEQYLPRPLAEKMMVELRSGEAGKILVDCFVSYVRQREVREEYENLAEAHPKQGGT